jgi:hypothetical protein
MRSIHLCAAEDYLYNAFPVELVQNLVKNVNRLIVVDSDRVPVENQRLNAVVFSSKNQQVFEVVFVQNFLIELHYTLMFLIVLNPVSNEGGTLLAFLHKHLFVVSIGADKIEQTHELAGSCFTVACDDTPFLCVFV